MLYDLILKNAQEWYRSDKCTVKPLIDHIQRNGNLREAQTQALLVYLYLKITGANKPLATLFNEGFFSQCEDLSALNINQKARDIFEKNTAARALFELSRTPLNNNGNGKKNQTTLFPDLERYIIQNPAAIDYHAFSKKLFYGVEYPDYLLSLPMGAGKTFLMAAIIYLDLYFAVNEPDNPAFAHNFLILAPSGLKSSIIPSLKTIAHFDPSWVLPEPAAGNIKRMIKFVVLDQPKSARKSNKARNPNAQKVSNYQPFDSLMGLVLVVNAEKVILDRLDLDKNGILYERTQDEKDRFANELRNIIGKIPNLQVHIDEVHHAATDDIKLRQVVNKWSANGSINSVLGFSGIPYLGKAEAVKISAGIEIKFTQITNTVFYYPLTEAVRKFLKKPRVEQTSGLSSIGIIEKGLSDFLTTFGDTVYENGCIAKCAVYCGNIERLEEEIYPHLTGKMKIKPEEILKYHKGNKRYKIQKEAETEFDSIDTSLSKKKIILLVQVGKEGWDCRSLTGVILSQKGDCPNNMVLQTSCRCLRQVDKGKHETALIWLNEDNAKTLDKQLKEEQHTSIREINAIGKEDRSNQVPRFSRIDYLKLPKIDFYQLHVEYETVVIEEDSQPDVKISAIDVNEHFDTAFVIERGLSPDDMKTKDLLEAVEGEKANFSMWIFNIARESMGGVTRRDLLAYEFALTRIFNEITVERRGTRYYNELFRQDEIRSCIRLAFHKHRELKVKLEFTPQSASLLLSERLLPLGGEHDKLYPAVSDVHQIMLADKTGKDIVQIQKELEAAHLKVQEFLKSQPNPDLFALAGINVPKQVSFSPAVVNKDATFHYLPYDFYQSRFELNFLHQGVDQIVHNYKRVENHEKIILHNQQFQTFLDTDGLVKTIGLIILFYDEDCHVLPSSVAPDIYQKEVPIHVFAWKDLKRMTAEIDTIPDLIYYLKDRYGYLGKTKSDIPLGAELDVLGCYKIGSNKFPERPFDFQALQCWDQYKFLMKKQIANRLEHNKASFFIDTLLNSVSKIPGNRKTIDGLPIGIYFIWELSMLSRRERAYLGTYVEGVPKYFLDKDRLSKHFAHKNMSTKNWLVFLFSKEESEGIQASLERLMEYKLMVEIEDVSFNYAAYGFGFKISDTFPPQIISLSVAINSADKVKGNYSKKDLEQARQKFDGELNAQKFNIEEFPL